MFGTIMGALVVAHYLGDYFVQTDMQAQHKGARGTRFTNFVGRTQCLAHALTYTLTLAGVLFAVFIVSGVELPLTAHISAWTLLVLNGATHYVIDRRWTLEAFARFIGKSGWIDNDSEALPKLDQAAHIVLLGVVAFVLTAII